MLIQADAFHLPYPDNLFHACVTSPPYWGLRKYAGEQGEEPLGLEATPELYIQNMVGIFREVWRVLRPDGIVWLNVGDCFAGGGRGAGGTVSDKQKTNIGSLSCAPSFKGIPAGNLMLMPHRLAIALQDDGWIVRNDPVWFKRNPMPESVAGWRWERKRKVVGNDPRRDGSPMPNKDAHRSHNGKDFAHPKYEYGDDYVLRKSSWRHTRAHEYVFMLTKKMGYFCNQEAVREPSKPSSIERVKTGWDGNQERGYPSGIQNHLSDYMGSENAIQKALAGRNPRSVLDVPTAPYSGAHYATFPPKLIAPLIRASVPRRCCPECGMAWAPVVEKGKVISRGGSNNPDRPIMELTEIGPMVRNKSDGSSASQYASEFIHRESTVTDYRPTCECGVMEHEPGIVLDIFGGSGTTGMVAKQLLRRWVVMDISRPYLDEQAKIRTKTGTPSKGTEGLPLFDGLEEGN